MLKIKRHVKGQSKPLLLQLYSTNVMIFFVLPSHSVVGLSQAG